MSYLSINRNPVCSSERNECIHTEWSSEDGIFVIWEGLAYRQTEQHRAQGRREGERGWRGGRLGGGWGEGVIKARTNIANSNHEKLPIISLSVVSVSKARPYTSQHNKYCARANKEIKENNTFWSKFQAGTHQRPSSLTSDAITIASSWPNSKQKTLSIWAKMAWSLQTK